MGGIPSRRGCDSFAGGHRRGGGDQPDRRRTWRGGVGARFARPAVRVRAGPRTRARPAVLHRLCRRDHEQSHRERGEADAVGDVHGHGAARHQPDDARHPRRLACRGGRRVQAVVGEPVPLDQLRGPFPLRHAGHARQAPARRRHVHAAGVQVRGDLRAAGGGLCLHHRRHLLRPRGAAHGVGGAQRAALLAHGRDPAHFPPPPHVAHVPPGRVAASVRVPLRDHDPGVRVHQIPPLAHRGVVRHSRAAHHGPGNPPLAGAAGDGVVADPAGGDRAVLPRPARHAHAHHGQEPDAAGQLGEVLPLAVVPREPRPAKSGHPFLPQRVARTWPLC
mmetsp:Transcript_60849/g.144871  ORF Transcript_60849/g.144871 Transcript_60849/m.144871 type:complete len:333 (+) Transcript_60849:285-1283(+)